MSKFCHKPKAIKLFTSFFDISLYFSSRFFFMFSDLESVLPSSAFQVCMTLISFSSRNPLIPLKAYNTSSGLKSVFPLKLSNSNNSPILWRTWVCFLYCSAFLSNSFILSSAFFIIWRICSFFVSRTFISASPKPGFVSSFSVSSSMLFLILILIVSSFFENWLLRLVIIDRFSIIEYQFALNSFEASFPVRNWLKLWVLLKSNNSWCNSLIKKIFEIESFCFSVSLIVLMILFLNSSGNLLNSEGLDKALICFIKFSTVPLTVFAKVIWSNFVNSSFNFPSSCSFLAFWSSVNSARFACSLSSCNCFWTSVIATWIRRSSTTASISWFAIATPTFKKA